MRLRVLAFVVALAAFAAAETPEAAADAVLEAFRAGGELKELAARDDPDPWLVADELLVRGEPDAAQAFARAAPRKDVEKLPDYVASRRGKPVDAAARTALAAANEALAAKDFARALALIEDSPPPKDDGIATVRQAYGRGLTLRPLSRLAESAEAFLTAARQARELGWLARASSALHEAGKSAWSRSDCRGALAAWEERLEIDGIRDDRAGVAGTLANIGGIHWSLGDYPKALEYQERALKLMDEIGDRAGGARSLGNIGLVRRSLGDYPKALELYERALKRMEEIGDHAGIAGTLANIGVVHQSLGDYPKALEYLERSLKLHEELGDRAGIAGAFADIGVVYSSLGDYPKALEFYDRALKLQEELGGRAGAAQVLGNIGIVHWSFGDYPKALEYQERALKLEEEIGDRAGIAGTLANVGGIHWSLGDYPKALEFYERALKLREEIGDRAGIARALGNIGLVHGSLRDYPKALDYEERALRLKEALGDRAGVAMALGNIGLVHCSLADYPKALEFDERALKLTEEIGDRAGIARTLGNIATDYHNLGNYPKALDYQERGLAEAERLGARDTVAYALWGLSQTHLALGDPARAAASSGRAVDILRQLATGLAEEEGAKAREQFEGIFEVGACAGLALDDTREVSFFLESGRAMTLLESLGGRRRIQGFVLPKELRDAEAEARAAESVALAVYRRALDKGGDVDPLWKEVEGARGRVIDATHRIQREAKAEADVLYPEAAPLERIRATLGEDEALVIYALLSDDALALVVMREAARIVRLGKSDAIAKAAAALQTAVLRPDERGVAAPPHERLEYVAKRLRALVVEPLGLEKTKRLLVAPHGDLAYVPFALLAPGLEIAYVPSGTTYELLVGDAALRGDGVLALGDPPAADPEAATVYRGAGPLPASRAEAQAVGDKTLVGNDATETGFLNAVGSRPRWRAVHFACHGLVRADLPELSALALGADAENDGFLTVLEVFRTRIPADLVVLSACETAKGKVYRAEGVIGLARAFMLAGSPRVICSLWKVDDAATRELMTTFYNEWKPGVGAAAALKKAQEHVASQKQWKDPYFWAAWQLWGLPE